MLRRFRTAGSLIALLLFAGCSKSGPVAVEGTVTYDGEPLPLGSIAFLPDGFAGIKAGGRIENGHFKIDDKFGPKPGMHKVEIHWLKPTGEKYKNEFKEEFDRYAEGLPDKYNKETILTAEIKSGSNVLEFKLEK